MSIHILTALPEDRAAIIKLLEQCDLPSGDVGSSEIMFFVAKDGQETVGVIGLERYGRQGLLRSFAVLPEYRNHKVGQNLFNHLLDYCSGENMETIHLLTTTAEPYFLKRGFVRTERSSAPPDIQSTAEFSHLCPSSSAYLVMTLKSYVNN